MSLFEILLLAIALAMDCFAVSIASGILLKRIQWSTFLTMAFFFGLFQGGMPLIGWALAKFASKYTEQWDHWIAFTLLLFIGGKMIYDALKSEDEQAHLADFSFLGLLSLAFATSMDTLATGVIFIPHPEVLWLAVVIIAATCFLFSMTGFILGHIVGTRLRMNVNILGGVILILIGLKIFLEGIL